MKSAVENLNPTRVKLTVEVPYEELAPSVEAAYLTFSQQVTIPGFRKGKVPPRIIDQRVGRGAVLQEAVQNALPALYSRAVEEANIRPLAQPSIEVTEVPDSDADDLTFVAEVDVRPEITLPDLSTITVTVDDAEVSDEDVEKSLTELRERFGTTVAVDRPAAEGDFVTLDLSASVDGEEIDSAKGLSHVVGSGQLLPGTDEAVTGLSVGETTIFEAPLAGEHAGKDAQVTMTLQAVKERNLAEADDDFAQMASEFDTLDELKTSLREQAGQAKFYEQAVQAREKLLEQLLDTVEFPLPDSIVEAEVNNHLESEGRLEDDEHRAEVTESTQRGIRAQLLLDALAEELSVEITQREMMEYLIQTSQQYGMDPNSFLQAVGQSGQMGQMASEVARRKGLTLAMEQAQVVDTAGNPVDFSELFVADDETDGGLEGADQDDVQGFALESEEVVASGAPAPAAADPTAIALSDLGGFIPDEDSKK